MAKNNKNKSSLLSNATYKSDFRPGKAPTIFFPSTSTTGGRISGNNNILTRENITGVMNYLDSTVPSWRTNLLVSPRLAAADIARSVGAAGVTAMVGWTTANFPGVIMPRIKGVLPGGSRKFVGDAEIVSESSGNDPVSPANSIFTTNTNPTFALSPAPSPKVVRIRTGVKPDTYVNDYMAPLENACSCLHTSTATLQLPTLVTSALNPLSNFVEKELLFDLVSVMQENLPFGVDTAIFSSANLASAFNDAIYALQIYFYYSSVLSYESDSRNQNAGMQQLRGLIDAATLTSFSQLGKRLENLPLPPRLVEWARFMNGNYFSGATQGSPIIKIVPSQAILLGATNAADTALANITRNNNVVIWSVLRKAKKKWRVGKLYDLPTVPIFNLNFKTIFSNLENGNRATGASVYYNSAATPNVNISYNTYTNNLDGLAYAMTSYNDASLSCHVPGLCQTGVTNATYPDTRYSYYVVSGNKNFYPVVTYPFLALSRDESNITVGTTTYYPHIFGADKCQSVNGYSLVQSAKSLLNFLFETSGSYDKFTKSAREF